MMNRNVQQYEAQVSRVIVRMKGASRAAWLAGLGALSRVQTNAPRVYADLVREGAVYEGRARRSALRAIDAVKATRGYETVEKAARTYGRKLSAAYAAPATTRARAATKRTARPATTRAKRAA
jgi:poly(hydroxyalkanoate) granule-associated protein